MSTHKHPSDSDTARTHTATPTTGDRSPSNLSSTLDSYRLMFKRAGPITLIIANLIPLAGVLFWDWNVGAVVTLYWSENLIIGAITLLKMFHKDGPRALGKMAFFLVHYGIFCIAHGAILAEVIDSHPMKTGGGFGAEAALGASQYEGTLLEPVVTIFSNASSMWMWAFTALLVSHVVSLFVNYFRREEYNAETSNSLMTAPYKRIMILHVTVLFGSMLVEKLGSQVYLLVALVLFKTIVDIYFHNREHRREGHAYAADDLLDDLNTSP